MIKNHPQLISIETNHKGGINLNSTNFSGFSNIKNLYITGHHNGAITFWDATGPFFITVLQLKQQSKNDHSLCGVCLTVLYFDINSLRLVSGDQSGMILDGQCEPITRILQDVIAGSYIFVRAHGSRDVRCSVCGSVLIDKFKEEIQLRGLKDQISVSACSHIGGHNYAGNLITFNDGPDGKIMGHWYGCVTRNDVLTLLDQHIDKERISYKLNSIDRGNMRAGLQQAVRILIASGTVEVETRRSDASKFLHVNEKENNGCGIITQCNSVKEDWDMDVNKSLVLPSKNKECQKHIANTLQVSEDQNIENLSTQPPLPPKPPDICCRGAAPMRYIVSDCDSVEVYYNLIHYIDYYYGDRTILAGRKEMEFMANFCGFQFWQHIFKELDKQLEQKEAEMKLVNNASVLKQHYEKKRNELEHEKLFMLDYHDLCLPYVSKMRKSEGATLYGSRSLFFLTSDGILKPPDIELSRAPINSKAQWKQVFTPDSDSSYWLKTHCVVEPIIIATHRQLSSMHPIFRLLHPHLRYTMEINKALRNDLINRGMFVEDPNAQHGVKLIIEDSCQ